MIGLRVRISPLAPIFNFMNKHNSDIRFRSHVDSSKGPDNCWNWLAFRDKSGYGTTYWRGKRGLKAHRVAYALIHGSIPDGLFVLHSCDNPSCCNPKHLYLGTHADNMADMVSKNRQVRGSKNIGSKLQASDVLRIKHLSSTGLKLREIVLMYDVSYEAIRQIVRGITWRHIK